MHGIRQLYQHGWKLEKREIVWYNYIAERTLTQEWREIFRVDTHE